MSSIKRRKGQSGRAAVVQCIQCGKKIPRDKAVEKRKTTLLLDRRLWERLKKQGTRLPRYKRIVYYYYYISSRLFGKRKLTYLETEV